MLKIKNFKPAVKKSSCPVKTVIEKFSGIKNNDIEKVYNRVHFNFSCPETIFLGYASGQIYLSKKSSLT